jgi:hypothetical protein
MVTIQGERFVPIPFRELIDPKTGRFSVRHVDVECGSVTNARRLHGSTHPGGLEDPERVRALARAGALDEATLLKRFAV